MSSVFGLINKTAFSNNINSEILGMQVWNLAYGKTAKNIVRDEAFYIGCCLDSVNADIEKTQPVISDDCRYYAIDAVIYNRDELLSKCNLNTDISDEALLVEYINANGLDALKKVNGDFAGAIYDHIKKELILFRDHMGVRPLFYYINNEFITFSTDIRGITGLLRANITLDNEWVYKTLNGNVPIELENTEYTNVFCVRPGSYLTASFSENTIDHTIKTYWQLGQKKLRFGSDLKFQHRLKELITDAIRRRLNVSKEKIGAELSGGLDSGVIDILINRLGKECLYYSWSHSPEDLPYAENDERLVINDICIQENIRCNFQQDIPDLETPLHDNMEKVGLFPESDSYIIDFAFPAYINAMTIANTSLFMYHHGISVIFSGHGGDEGVSHRANPYEMYVNHEYYHFLRYMWSQTHGLKHRLRETVKRLRSNIKDNKKRCFSEFIGPIKAPEFINEKFKDKMKNTKGLPPYFAYDPINYIKHGGSRNRMDNASLLGAYCNVRYVFPYLDYRVIDYAVSIPRYQFLRGRRNRYIFRESFKDIMPKSLYQLVRKEDASRKNLKPNPKWYEDYLETKASTFSKLNKETWGKYLDFDKLNSFMHKDKPDKEEVHKDYLVLQILTFCIMAQNALEKSQEVSLNLKEESDP